MFHENRLPAEGGCRLKKVYGQRMNGCTHTRTIDNRQSQIIRLQSSP